MEQSASQQDRYMTEHPSKGKLEMALPQIQGTVNIKLNRSDIARVDFYGKTVTVNLKDTDYVKHLSGKAPHGLKKLSTLRHVATLLFHIGLTVEVFEGKGELVSMGKEIHGILGHIKLNLIRARKFI